jgi:predicted permease
VGAGRGARWLEVVARLRPGVAPAEGRAQVAALLARLGATYPATNAGWTGVTAEPVRDAIVGPVRRGLLVLLGAVVLVLLVACVNVANLLLVRGTGRGRELALRAALGAGRGRVLRLLLTESVFLALAGGALGTLAAWWAVRAFVALSGDALPRAADVRLDGAVLAFAVAASVLTGVVFGAWPALQAWAGVGLAPALREGGRGSVGGASNRARSALVASEVALAVVLVAGAGLLLRSFQRLTAVDLGFRPQHVLLAHFSVQADDDGARRATRERVVDRVRRVPGVLEAGFTKHAPLTGDPGEAVPFTVPGRAVPPGEEPRVHIQPASPGYLRALGVPLLAGQDLTAAANDSAAPRVAVVSRQMAERVWPGRPAVGQTFLLAGNEVRVVGVAGDVRNARLDSLAGFTAYLPEASMPRSSTALVVRTAGDPARLAGPVRAAVREVLPGQPFREVVPLTDKLSAAASTPRLFAALAAAFGGLALALAAVGLYGVVAYAAGQRERELGLRLALGAPPRRVLALVLRQGMAPVAAGLAAGLAGALAVTRVLGTLLFEVSATDAATLASVTVLLGAVGLAAAYLPSRRAARLDPATTLRAE